MISIVESHKIEQFLLVYSMTLCENKQVASQESSEACILIFSSSDILVYYGGKVLMCASYNFKLSKIVCIFFLFAL